MGDQRVDERVPHEEAVRLGGRRGPHGLLEYELRAWLERGWSAAGARLVALTEEERVVSYRRALCTGGWT